MFSQFRAQYPHGSIITEMLAKIDEKHVFRATIKTIAKIIDTKTSESQNLEQIILCTATAADPDLEKAEDRAIARALSFLGLAIEPNFDIQTTQLPQITTPVLKPQIIYNEHFLEQAKAPILHQDSILPEEDAPIFPESAPANNSQPNYLKSNSSEKALTTDKSPIDLSSQLSQIMVEMDRIGWGKLEGRDFLQKRYQKQSRDQLSPTEIIDFLEYLKSQSDTF